jgi:hypothetical protein
MRRTLPNVKSGIRIRDGADWAFSALRAGTVLGIVDM